MARQVPNRNAFETLSKEVREYLVELTGEESATQALRKIRDAMTRVKEISDSITRASLERAAQNGFEIQDGVVHEPEEGAPPGEVFPARPLVGATEAERQQARDVQAKLLPTKVPTVPGIQVGTFSRFSRDVGGDYYDFIELPGGRVGVIIADASGKGVAAAMVMVMFRTIFRIVASNDHEPAEALLRTNKLLTRDLLRGMFVSALYGVLDPQRHTMALANAGHFPPLICRARLSGTRAINVRGPAIGLLDSERFAKLIRQKTLRLERGDTLCLYTDGITEAENLIGEQFGYRTLARTLRDSAALDAEDIIKHVVAAVDDFQENAPQHDDITLIVLQAQ